MAAEPNKHAAACQAARQATFALVESRPDRVQELSHPEIGHSPLRL